jgi:CDP-paratose 2-epimerase
MKVFITGSSGLIGSELVSYFDLRAQSVIGIDNNMRADFFGPEGDTRWNLRRLVQSTRHFRAYDIDVRDYQALQRVLREEGPFDRMRSQG